MSRNSKDKRKRRLAREQAKRLAREKRKSQPRLELADNSYVDAMMEPDALRLLAAHEMIADPRVNIWLLQLDQRLDAITQGSPITRKQAEGVLRFVNDWENRNAGKLKSRVEATASIARMLDQIIAALKTAFTQTDPQEIQARAQTIGEIVNAIQIGKSNFVSTANRIMLPEGQAAVSSYLYCMKKLLEGASGVVRDLDDKGLRNGIELARKIWAEARDARVFEIPAVLWQGLYQALDTQFAQAATNANVPKDHVRDWIRVNAAAQPFPEKLPFEHIYIGLGAGVMLDPAPYAHTQDKVIGVNLLGYLICGPARQVYEMLHVITLDSDFFLPLAQCRYNGEWSLGETLAAWLVPQLVDLINEHNTVVINHEPTGKMRDDFRKTGKGAPRFLPKPYYTVRLKHKIIDESEEDRTSDTGFGHVLSHRYDRRGHERCFLQRGPLPLDEKTEKKLLKYGYRFILGKPNAEDAARLAYRQIEPKRSNEWMAIKTRWIEDTVVGDEKLPYIPAVRVPEKLEASS